MTMITNHLPTAELQALDAAHHLHPFTTGDEINAKGARRAFAERVAMNPPIQGTAADIIKMAMIDIQQRIEDEKLPMRMLLQVHDELVFELAPEYAEEGRALVLDRMENIVSLDVPLKVDGDLGDNWLEAK